MSTLGLRYRVDISTSGHVY